MKHHNATLTMDQARRIRAIHAERNVSCPEIAKRFGVSANVIKRVISGANYREPVAPPAAPQLTPAQRAYRDECAVRLLRAAAEHDAKMQRARELFARGERKGGYLAVRT